MFQNSDDLNVDEDFLSDAFDIPTSVTYNDQNKRLSDEVSDLPSKKLCTESKSTNTENIISIIKQKCNTENTYSVNVSTFTEKNRRIVQRKFPGPAGIINKKMELNEIVCSQFSEDSFKKDPWQQMITEWSVSTNGISLPLKYTIAWLKSKATSKKLIGQKTPFLAVMIHSIDKSNINPMIILKDKTGEIKATVLCEVWEKYSHLLMSGSVIVLKQIGVLSTLKEHYLTITPTNLLTIYNEQETREINGTTSVHKTNVQKITISEIMNEMVNLKCQHQKFLNIIQTSAQTSINPYFKTSSPKINEKRDNNKIVQLISNNKTVHENILTNNPSTLQDFSNSTPQKLKFDFKSKINSNNNANDKNKENTLEFNTSTSATSISETEAEILTQVLDGVDASSLFEDF